MDTTIIKIKNFKNVISDTSDSFNGYKLLSNGNVQKIVDGIIVENSTDFYDDSFKFSNAKWELAKDNARIIDSIIVEGDLSITGKNIVIHNSLFISGNITSINYFVIDINQPFEKALVVDGNIEVADLSVVGKMESLGDIIINGNFDLIGTVKSEKSIVINGNARINYLDTIYKAALAGAQSEFNETLLAHSQVFKDLEGRNAMAIFTFRRGYVLTNEENILSSLQNNTIVINDYYSKFIGATLDYGTTIGQEEGLSIYYSNKLFIENMLREIGYSNFEISEALYIECDSFYITYIDKSGNIIGTYQMYGNGLDYSKNPTPILLTDKGRNAAIIAMKNLRDQRLMLENNFSLNKQKSTGRNAYVIGDRVITKNMLKNAGIDEGDIDKTPAELRLAEWVDFKSMDEEELIVDVDVVVN